MTSSITHIYEGRWNRDVYVYALSFKDAKEKVLNHSAFGDPQLDEYAIGDKWASAKAADGWRIAKTKRRVYTVVAQVVGDPGSGDTAHLVWQCPLCRRIYSEGLTSDAKPPMLVMCERKHKKVYAIADFRR